MGFLMVHQLRFDACVFMICLQVDLYLLPQAAFPTGGLIILQESDMGAGN
jgi:hypothetical protein